LDHIVSQRSVVKDSQTHTLDGLAMPPDKLFKKAGIPCLLELKDNQLVRGSGQAIVLYWV